MVRSLLCAMVSSSNLDPMVRPCFQRIGRLLFLRWLLRVMWSGGASFLAAISWGARRSGEGARYRDISMQLGDSTA